MNDVNCVLCVLMNRQFHQKIKRQGRKSDSNGRFSHSDRQTNRQTDRWPAMRSAAFCVFDVCVFALFQCVRLLVVLAGFIIIIIIFYILKNYFILYFLCVFYVCYGIWTPVV